MGIMPYLAIGFLVAVFAMQGFVWLRAKRMQGQQVPGGAEGGRRLYYFYGPNCGPCRSVTPVVDRLASRHANVHKVDVSVDAEQARRFGVRATPTLMLVEDGRIERVILGGASEQILERLLAGDSVKR